jgi:hypothetical protein
MQPCRACGHEEFDTSRFCTRCGTPLSPLAPVNPSAGAAGRDREEMNLPILYAMVAVLLLALLVPPWEAPPGRPPVFLGFHFILHPPESDQGAGVISGLLLTIELVTIAVAGLYFSWVFRKRG